jgi:SOS response regulatory protein OraA/RecX
VLAKKRSKYDDEQKLIAYLMRQGFSYDTIRDALNGDTD